MTRPRSALISLETTPYYHCIARCVRRAFFFGVDEKGRDLNYRKPWFLQRLKLLGEVFAIDVAAYAVMSNHYHLVLHVDAERAMGWSQDEVIERWLRLYKGPELVRRHALGEALSDAELQVVRQTVEVWRERLFSISWFMSCLNYYIALHANKEDGCTGHFWEGRFISQALVDEAALLSCMVYVDLNPVRAGIAESLEDSDFTSIQERIRQVRGRTEEELPVLMPFSETLKDGEPVFLPFGLKAYMELADWTGRARRKDKRGHISNKQPKLLTTLGLSGRQWELLSQEIRQEAATMLRGLTKVAVIERRGRFQKAA
jgi:REP element-mobilizing transposase RayT